MRKAQDAKAQREHRVKVQQENAQEKARAFKKKIITLFFLTVVTCLVISSF